jgi:hypothetical protein
MTRIPHKSWILLAALVLACRLHADEHLFGYSYEADLLPKGALEFELWATNLNGQAEGVFSRWKLRQELEYGLTDTLSASLYLNFNDVYTSINDPVKGTQSQESFGFDGLSTEWKWQVLSPYKDVLGLVLYFEPRYSGTELELEPKLILQKNLGESWVMVLNLTPETEYAYAADGQTMHAEEFLSLGVARKLGPAALGLELLNHRLRPDWGDETSSAWYLGPSFHFAAEKWWATLTLLPQVQGQPSTISGDPRTLGSDDFAKVETRLLAGLEF